MRISEISSEFQLALVQWRLKFGSLAPRVRISLLGRIVPHSLDRFFRWQGDDGLEEEVSDSSLSLVAILEFSISISSGCLRFLPLRFVTLSVLMLF